MDPSGINNMLQAAVDGMLARINVKKIRPIQKQTYLNMAKCFDMTNDQQIEQCTNNESVGVKVAQQIVQAEMGQFSNRVQRCMQDCEDSTRDQLGSADLSDPKTQDKAASMMTKCAKVCADKHIAMLASVEARILKDLEEKLQR
mgnify:FL=1